MLAGYDLGAQTVAALLGEQSEGLKGVALPVQPLAAIVISPSVNLAKGHVNTRFQTISAPLLVITGVDDNDPYAIGAGSTRQLLWQYCAPGNKYLLLLDRTGHSFFSGADWGEKLSRILERSEAVDPDLPTSMRRAQVGYGDPQTAGFSGWLVRNGNPLS